jgi:hypothetical protein
MYKSKMNKTVKNSKTTTPSAKSTKSTPATPANWSAPVNSTPSPKRGRRTLAEKLEIVSARIRRGDFTAIAKATGYDNTHVSKVIRGFANNPSGEIVNYAYDFVGKRKVTA